MGAKVHGKNPADLPGVLEGFQRYHREELITVQQDDSGWLVMCRWWHVLDQATGALVCCPPGGGP